MAFHGFAKRDVLTTCLAHELTYELVGFVSSHRLREPHQERLGHGKATAPFEIAAHVLGLDNQCSQQLFRDRELRCCQETNLGEKFPGGLSLSMVVLPFRMNVVEGGNCILAQEPP